MIGQIAIVSDNETVVAALPKGVRNLIADRLRLCWREQEERYFTAIQIAYTIIKKEITAVVGTSKVPRAYTSIPLCAFEGMVTEAFVIMKGWPGQVWECITSILDKAQMQSFSSDELKAIFNAYVWGEAQTVFRNRVENHSSFKENFVNIVLRLGVQKAQLDRYSEEFDKELAASAKKGGCSIHNAARFACEEVYVAIEEYVLARQANAIEATTGDSSEAPLAEVEAYSQVPSAFKQCEIFRSMENLTFDELTLMFVGDKADSGLASNNMLEISARNQSRRVALGELDLVDRRNGTLNSQAAILLGMAKKKNPPLNPGNSAKMSRLRKVLCGKLGIGGDPFYPPHKHSGWMPRFKITDRRGLADERARDEAERRTISLEQRSCYPAASITVDNSEDSSETSREPGEDWLRDNDPHYQE